MMNGCDTKALTLDTINPHVIKIEYAVRGPIVQRALQIEEELKKGAKKNFNEVIKCNIGDCHATGQHPLTFFRQVMALLAFPELANDDRFPDDVKQRAFRILHSCGGGSIGSYSNSLGIQCIREEVAAYIERRDGISVDSNNVFLTSGATEAIKIDYYLDESRDWALTREELERALRAAHGKCVPRALVVINPGNPTGQVLSRSCMEDVIRFACKHHLVLLADEVYQFNVYQPKSHPWISFKRVLHEMGPPYVGQLELASFMSCSKGFMGECGFRGGYCELSNFDPDVKAQLYKALSARLCPPVIGQVGL
ncbi:unnamed protein product [Echinostoma caproni]|uniref:alanine transaminase n=1 Tax=Echinostoma caproni TaxID=27848 RepID=A0A183B0M8_9TREM|nr:unnamed protein product [Echinostoma caproni]